MHSYFSEKASKIIGWIDFDRLIELENQDEFYIELDNYDFHDKFSGERFLDYLIYLKVKDIKVSNPNNSCVAWVTGVTDDKPVALPEREIGSLPDVDIDVSKDHRQDVIDYLVSKYGKDNVAPIATFNSFALKSAIRAVARTLEYPYEIGDKLSKMSPDPVQGKNLTFLEALEEVPELKRIYEEGGEGFNGDAQKILKEVKLIEGIISSVGTHASGVVISPFTLTDLLPLQLNNKDMTVVQYDMEDVEALGLVKFDILGIKTLTTLKMCADFIKERFNITIDFENIPLDDPNVYKMICEGFLLGIFQLETSSGMRQIVKQIQPKCIEDLSDILAIYRPGPLGSSELKNYLECKTTGKEPKYAHPALEPILKPTSGLMLYQEQIMRIARDICGYTMVEGDSLRKCVSGDTLFWTQDGYKHIKDMVRNRKRNTARTLTNYEIVDNKIDNAFKSGIKDTIKIITESRSEIICTPDHEIFTNEGYIQAKDLTRAHYLLHDITEKYGTYDIDEDLLFLIAALVTEGHTGKNAWYFCNKDKIYIDKFIDAFYNIFKYIPKTHIGGNDVIYVQIKADASKYLTDNFPSIVGTSAFKSLPFDFLNLVQEKHLKLLSWMIDFDGWADDRHIAYCTKSIKLAAQVKLLFENIGCGAYILNKKVKGYGIFYNVHIGDRQDILRAKNKLIYSEKISSKNFSTTRDAKRNYVSKYTIPSNIYKPIIDSIIKQSGYSRNELVGKNISGSYFSGPLGIDRLSDILSVCGRSKELEFYLNREVYWDKIRSITPNGEIDVYDFSMTERSSPRAFANNILIHNCVGKKKAEELLKHEEKFVSGGIRLGFPEKMLRDLFNNIKSFGAYGFNKCLTGDTKVKTPDGIKAIESLKVPCTLLSMDANNNIIENECVEKIDCGEQDVYEIEFSDSCIIKCTLDHKFMCGDNKMHSVRDIIKDDLTVLA